MAKGRTVRAASGGRGVSRAGLKGGSKSSMMNMNHGVVGRGKILSGGGAARPNAASPAISSTRPKAAGSASGARSLRGR